MTHLVDLTRRVESGMPTYPGDPAVDVTPHATHGADGYRVSRLELGTHAGTHIDAPAHTEADGATLGSFDVDRFRFDARLVDCRGVGANGEIGPNAVPERDGNGDEEREMLVFRTGWETEWGTDRMTDHPYLAPKTAERCADRGFHVGTDALSPDPTGAESVPAHRALLGSERLIVENLCNLGSVPERFELLALPLRVDADGAPVRAVARA
ncbi:cyclase family protein [Halogeometricum luteum]|uniref:Cyclase family protein n=1 Tax=Halogeometricum luteum TaxID=2950537 RepID=A0ABU2G1L6_9EURY|nr:cyclase family protein [Halogeometricum sp. S3BR5-2]MDS0294680.1 cyclase family protein [Halogeometricum sp. S3BR5-2]